MLLNLNRDIKFHTFEFLTGTDLILFDISLNTKYREENLKIYKLLRNIILDENCITYFIKHNLNIHTLNIFSFLNYDLLNNLKIENVNINIDIDPYYNNIKHLYEDMLYTDMIEFTLNKIHLLINTLSVNFTSTNDKNASNVCLLIFIENYLSNVDNTIKVEKIKCLDLNILEKNGNIIDTISFNFLVD